MKRITLAAGLLLTIAAAAALAHPGVQDPTVKAWMHSMSSIGDNTKVLGTMAKGEIAFDADAARNAARAIASDAAQISALFANPASDPKSEALPVIWETYSDFLAKAVSLELAASTAARDIATPADLRPALAAIGASCKGCHQIYRKPSENR